MPPPGRLAAIMSLASAVVLTAACGARAIRLPTDAGTVLPEFSTIHADVTRTCQSVRTLVTVLSLSGRAGGQRLAGSLHAGFRAPDDLYMEHEYGTILFVLTSSDGDASLFLPRENRVVRDEPTADLLGALTGVSLGAADLLAVLTGCVVPSPIPVAGRVHQNGWASIDLDGGAQVFLQRVDGQWRVRAARRHGLQVEYPEWPASSAVPTRVVIRADEPVRVDLRASVSQADLNGELTDAVFVNPAPAGARPLSIEELRRNGPLREDR
jgi:hypothetical protein